MAYSALNNCEYDPSDDIDEMVFLCDRIRTLTSNIDSNVDDIKRIWQSKRQYVQPNNSVTDFLKPNLFRTKELLHQIAGLLSQPDNLAEALSRAQQPTHIAVEHQQQQVNHMKQTRTRDNILRAKSPIRHTQPQQNVIPSQSRANQIQNPLLSSVESSQPQVFGSTATVMSIDQNGYESHSNDHIQGPQTLPINDRNKQSSASDLLVRQTPTQPYSQISSHQPLPYRPPSSSSLTLNSITGQQPAYRSQLTTPLPPPNTISRETPLPETRSLSNRSSLSEPQSPPEPPGKTRIKMQVIRPGTVWRNAEIQIVDHPSAFFVQNMEPKIEEQFRLMAQEMNAFYNKSVNTMFPMQNISIGDFCVAQFSEDDCWYRARIVLQNSPESVLVVYVDYGNSESKPANQIYPLHESLACLPAMTVACTLAEAFPKNDNFWPRETTDLFSSLVKNKIVEVHFIDKEKSDWPLHFVKIFIKDQPVTSNPALAPLIIPLQNETIAQHFAGRLSTMEYILYNVPVLPSDIYNKFSFSVDEQSKIR